VKKLLLGVTFLVLILIIIGIIFNSRKDSPLFETINNTQITRISHELPIEKRSYKVGFSGYFPAHFDSPTTTDVRQFFADINEYAEIYGVHVNIDDTNVLKVASSQQSHPIVFVTSPKDPKSWKTDKDKLLSQLKQLLSTYKNIEYLGIGNEINTLYDQNTTDFTNFLETYTYLYGSLKKEFPNVKIFTTFQYESLIGKAHLTGKKATNELAMVQLLDNYVDVVGITLYPHLEYTNPETIPGDYLSQIRTVSQKPIVVTETGWLSRTKFGNQLDNTDYRGNEDKQVVFLKKLTTLLDKESVEVVNWFSLHDPADWENGKILNGFILFDSFGVKKYNGEEKKVFALWKELISISNK